MRLVAGVDGILFSEAFAVEGVVVFAKACELGLEGIVRRDRAASIRAGEAATG
jgi:ATP-dependent DNA ligase